MRLISKFQLLFFLGLLFFINSKAQCFKENKAFKGGEKLSFFVYYNMGFIWVDAGTASFDIYTKLLDGKKVYMFDSYGNSLPKHDWFFKVRSHYVSWLNSATLKPVKYERRAVEGSYWAKEDYVFDHKKNKAYLFTENAKRPYKKDSVTIGDCTFDVLNAVYYCRNLNFSGYKVNDKIPVSILIDNQKYNLYVRYLGKETIKTRDKSVYRCIKFKALLIEGTMFKGGEDLTVWVTDDENKIPVLIEAQILIGSIKVYLTKAEGLIYPISAKIK